MGLILLAVLVPLDESWASQVVLIPLLLILPGVILLRALRITGSAIAANPVYVPCASLLVLVGSGLAVDLVGPLLGVAEPLRAPSLLIGLEIACAALLACSRKAGDETRIPWDEIPRPGRLAWPVLLALFGAAGALRLNAGHGNQVAALAILAVTGALGVVLLIAPAIDDALLVVVVYASSLSMLWSFALRGDLVYGFDIQNEYYALQQTVTAGIWHVYHPGDAYGAMLSLTVLPTELHALTGMPALLIFKVVYPMIGALFPVAVFSIARRYLAGRWAFLAAAFVVMQQPFFQEYPALARQEISTALFAALIAAVLEVNTAATRRSQWAFISLLSAAMVTSHYSTDYMTIILLSVALVVQFFFSWFRAVPHVNGSLVVTLCVCLGGAFVWYGMLTHSTSNVSQFLSIAATNGLDILPNRSGNLISSYLNGEQSAVLTIAQYQKYIANYSAVHMSYVKPLPNAAHVQYALQAASGSTPASAWPLASHAMNLVSLLVQQLMNLLAGIGALMLSLSKKAPMKVRQLGMITLAAMFILVLARFSGTFAAEYNPQRTFLQMLIVLAAAICWPLTGLGRWKIARTVVLAGCVVGVMVSMVGSSTLEDALLGGGVADANLANQYADYQEFVVSTQEIASATWLNDEAPAGQLIYADYYGQLRLTSVVNNRPGILDDITPQTIDASSWVYADRTNVLDGIVSSNTGAYFETYAFPKLFLDENFDTVYTNGISEVFHR
ncbi:MAG TPA: DUF2206 domain-containing protein [Steroidobacteraceae bacterium]